MQIHSSWWNTHTHSIQHCGKHLCKLDVISTFMVTTNGLAEQQTAFCQQSPAVRNYAWRKRLRVITTMRSGAAAVRSGASGRVWRLPRFLCPVSGAWELKQMSDQLLCGRLQHQQRLQLPALRKGDASGTGRSVRLVFSGKWGWFILRAKID